MQYMHMQHREKYKKGFQNFFYEIRRLLFQYKTYKLLKLKWTF